jgi:RNA polymerase sigma-70 factor, ECF subfamily
LNSQSQTDNSFERLIESVKRGDSNRFGNLYDYSSSLIYRYLRLHSDGEEEAETLTIEVYLHAWRDIVSDKIQQSSLLSSLFKISRKILIQHHRKRIGSSPIDSYGDIILNDPNESGKKDHHLQNIKFSLTLLPYEYAKILEYRFLIGLSISETARIINMSESKTKILQFRALSELKKFS